MRISDHFFIAYGVGVFCLVFKVVASKHVVPEHVRRLHIRMFGISPPDSGFRRQFRSLGFDLANASVGLLAVACVLEGSNLMRLCGQVGTYSRLLGVVFFAIFAVLYVVAAKVRYTFLEAAEIMYDSRKSWLFGMIAVVISVMIIVWLCRLSPSRRWLMIALALILGGALGNLGDRLIHGYVIDFLDFYVAQWHWPAFNIADSSIVVGGIMLIIDMFFSRAK